MGAEGVGISLRDVAEGVGRTQVSGAARTPPVACLTAILLSRHTFQQADLLLFLLPLGPVPHLPLLPLKWVAVAWECGIFLRQRVSDIAERVTVCLAILVAWHLALGTPVRGCCTPKKKRKAADNVRPFQLNEGGKTKIRSTQNRKWMFQH